ATGRATFTFYEPRMSAIVVNRIQREGELRRAIAQNELRLHYQPTFDLPTGGIVNVKALVRWQHPELGLLPQGDFIAAAEASGQIVAIGAWVLHEACLQAQRWRRLAAANAPMICVNLPARQLQQQSLVGDVAEVLRSTGLDPSWLELEITESAVMTDAEAAQWSLNALRALGVRLAVDDFGTGYASLSYLRDIPAHTVKIDRSFVAGLGTDVANSAIIRAIASLAGDLGIEVTAEGIETVEQLELILDLGIVRGQGYYFTRPLPHDAIDALIMGAAPVSTHFFARPGRRALA
ncbi:MAG: putative bifunctional diguanylate cyclase/phosphodiesterase, partial [Thermomicrobiales bacterium]